MKKLLFLLALSFTQLSFAQNFDIRTAPTDKNYQGRNEKVRNGIFTHEILAKITTTNDVEKVLKSYLLEGLITETEKSEIAEM